MNLAKISAALLFTVGASALLFAVAQAQQTTTNSSVTKETEQVHSTGVHHYQDPAEEAHDAMLITRVKTALATDGVANGHPVEVDCDHGVARLTGVVGSADDARHAAQIAANVPGVTGVDNKLTWK
jgi:osmotically-inducible protein OsmY